MRLQEFNTGVL
jgi:hypothetical protein